MELVDCGVTGIAPGSGVDLWFCIIKSHALLPLSLLVGELNSLKVKTSLLSLTHSEGTNGEGEAERVSNTSGGLSQ